MDEFEDLWSEEMLGSLFGEESDEEKEMLNLLDQFEDIFDYRVSYNMIDTDYETLRQILKKSIETKKNYLKRYLITESDDDKWIEEALQAICMEEGNVESAEISTYIKKIFYEKEIYRLNVDEAYAVIHHLYVLLKKEYETDEQDEKYSLKNQAEAFIAKTLKEMAEESVDDLWEPMSLRQLHILYDEVYAIAEKIALSNTDAEEAELRKISEIPEIIEKMRDELEMEQLVYRRVEDVELIWAYIENEIISDYKYVTTHDDTSMSERLKAKLKHNKAE